MTTYAMAHPGLFFVLVLAVTFTGESTFNNALRTLIGWHNDNYALKSRMEREAMKKEEGEAWEAWHRKIHMDQCDFYHPIIADCKCELSEFYRARLKELEAKV